MSGGVTNGFDMLVRLTETAISEGMEMLPAGGAFPLVARRQVTLPIQAPQVPAAQVPYDTVVELERPAVTLDAANNRVVVRCELGPSSQLSTPPIVSGLSLLQQVPLTGFVEFTCLMGTGFAVVPGPETPFTGRAVLALLSDAGTTTEFTMSPVTVGTVTVGGAAVVISASTLQSALEGAFPTLAATIDDLPITTPIPLASGPTPVRRLAALDARILPAPTGGRPSLGLGALTEASSGLGLVGNINAVTPIQGLVGGAVDVANVWLIQLVAETLEQSPGFFGVDLAVDTSVPNATFSGSAHIDPPDGDAFTLKSMTVELADGAGVRITGEGEMSGFCWSADFDFNLVLNFVCDPATGALTATSTEPVVNADAHIPLLCVIVIGAIIGIIIGALTAWIVGVIVGIITAIILATIDVGVPELPVGSIPGLFNAFGGIPLPLPVGTAGLLIETCSFDDLAVRGTPLYVDLSPRAASGLRDGPVGTGFDLDAGTKGSIGGTEIDLAWLGTELQPRNGCELQVVGVALDRLTLSDLQALTYGTTTITAAQIPTFLPPPDLPWPLPDLPPLVFAGPPLVVAARTSEARYAKFGVWRRVTDNALFVSFDTYASPVLSLSLEAFVHTTKNRVVERGEEPCLDVIVDPVLGADDLDILAERLRRGSTTRSRATSSRGARRRALGPHVIRPPFVGGDLVLDGGGRPGHVCSGSTTVHAEQAAFWVLVERAQEVVVRAVPTLFAVPVNYRWTVFGTTLTGSGHTIVDGVRVEHDETSPRLVLKAPMGTDIVGQVCVLAIDAAGRKCERCLALDRPGRIKLGGCRPCPEPRTLDGFLRMAPTLDRWEAGASAATLRLQALAAGAKVPPARKPVKLRDALLKAPERPRAARRASKGGTLA